MDEKLEYDNSPERWYERGYLPHFEGGTIPQMVTFRLVDSLPQSCINEWETELAGVSPKEADLVRRCRMEEYLDLGSGSAWLSQSRIAEIVNTALLYFDGERYKLHAWVVMPNHVHVLFTPMQKESVTQIVHSWKSFTSNKANKVIGKTGPFWQREFFDRFVRNAEHFELAIKYVEFNPVKANLCRTPSEWRYSSAFNDQVCLR